VPVENPKLVLAGAGFHDEQISSGRGHREVAPFDFHGTMSAHRVVEVRFRRTGSVSEE
jgi:hypothetical protein